MTALTIEQAFSYLHAGATLVTASQRLSRGLAEAFDQQQLAAGRPVWPTPDILPWNAWLRRGWSAYLPTLSHPAVLLSPVQVNALWQHVIEQMHAGRDLIDAQAAAENAASAAALAYEWDLAASDDEWAASPDTAAFRSWQQAVSQELRSRDAITPAELPSCFTGEALRHLHPPGHPLIVAGFDDWAPRQLRLLERLQAAGTECFALETRRSKAAQAALETYSDTRAELEAAALWAAGLAAAGHRVAVVVPDLASRRDEVERIFTEVLHPASVGDPDLQPAFNLSAGRRLTEYPVIDAARVALRAARDDADWADVCALLTSPFVSGAETEYARRGILAAEIRRRGNRTVSLQTIEWLAQERGCPDLASAAGRLRRRASIAPNERTLPEWARWFSEALRDLGWPGERARTSSEYQAITEWQSALSEFASLDAVLPPASFAESLSLLERLLADRLWQPRRDPAPIQVMGLLETSGLQFDYLRVTGSHDEIFPSAASPSPWLPVAAQRRHDLPHCSAERELRFAERTLERLLHSAAEIVFSVPNREGDRQLRPSPLLAVVPRRESAAQAHLRWSELIWQSRATAVVEDDRGAPLPEGTAAGGTNVIEHMAACPFRAYTRYRLNARELEEPRPGLTPITRGSVLHQALHEIWNVLRGSEGLRDCADLSRLVSDAVSRALENAARKAQALSGKLRELEQERCEGLILAWLEVERARSPFRVLGTESETSIEVGGVRLNARLDRIDELPGGAHVLIDYKNGEATPNSWDGARPDKPQLPLYAVAHNTELAAVAFARIRAGDVCFAGVASAAGVLPGVEKKNIVPIRRRVAEWRSALDALGAAYRTGEAVADPKTPQTCRYCGYGTLCRAAEGRACAEDR